MKFLTIILFVSCGIFVSIECSKDVKCPTKNALLPNPGDCTTYIECSNGVPIVMPCPTGLYFDKETKKCDYPDSADCNPTNRVYYEDGEDQRNYISDVRISNEIKCPDDESKPYIIPGPKCNTYFKCNNGIPVEIKCPPGLAFNPNLDKCDIYPCKDDN